MKTVTFGGVRGWFVVFFCFIILFGYFCLGIGVFLFMRLGTTYGCPVPCKLQLAGNLLYLSFFYFKNAV